MRGRWKQAIGRVLPVALVLAGAGCLVYAFLFHEVATQPAGGSEQGAMQPVKEPTLVEQVTHGGAVLDATGKIEQTPAAGTEEPCPT